MDDKVNLAEKLELLDRPYSPGIVGFLNDYKLAVVQATASSYGTSTRKPTTSSSFSEDASPFSFAIATSNFAKGRCSWFRAAWSTARRRPRKHTSS
jgi:hypothetical protein